MKNKACLESSLDREKSAKLLSLLENFLRDKVEKNDEIEEENYSENTRAFISIQLPFLSLCKDTLLPFYGKVRIQYRFNRRKLSFGRLKKLLDEESRVLSLQEELNERLSKRMLSLLGEQASFKIEIWGNHICMLFNGLSVDEICVYSYCEHGEKE